LWSFTNLFNIYYEVFFYYVAELFLKSWHSLLYFIKTKGNTAWPSAYTTSQQTDCIPAEFLPEKLTGTQLFKKFPLFYGTRRIIAAFTKARHLFLSWVVSVLPTHYRPAFWRSTLILLFHLRLGRPSVFFPSGLSTNTMYAPLLSHLRATYLAYLLLWLITRMICGDKSIKLLVIQGVTGVTDQTSGGCSLC
jgi:hypothetical protein